MGIGWNKVAEKNASPLDLDLHVALCDVTGRAIGLVYHQNQVSACGSVYLTGDNPDGDGPGWDEAIGINWAGLSDDVVSVEAFVTIDEADERKQCFAQVAGGYVSATDSKGTELISHSLPKQGEATGLIIARARRADGWDIRFPFEAASFSEIVSSLGITA
jgi:tellurium resistance protein TerZ